MSGRTAVAVDLGQVQRAGQELSPLMRLPPEIRCKIFRYFLSTSYTKRPLGYYDDTYAKPWYYSTPQPHYYYDFHTSILHANKKIYREAAYILYNENLFILVSINDESVLSNKGLLSGFIEHCGVPVLARERQARGFQRHAMKLYIGHWIEEDTRLRCFDASVDQAQKSTMRTELLIALDDLSLLCKSYMKFSPLDSKLGYDVQLRTSFVRLEIPEGRSQPLFETEIAVRKPTTYERRLLEPFRRLHSQASIHIEGAISPGYKSEIEFDMMKAPQVADDLLRSITVAQEQAEEHFHHGNLDLARKTYQTVIEDIELGYEWPPKSGRPLHRNSQRGDKVIFSAELHVRSRLSEICLMLERPIQVLRWGHSALATLRDHMVCTYNNQPRRLLRAQLYYQVAWASHQLGVRCRALDSIQIARMSDPDNDVYERVEHDWLEEEAQQPHKHGENYPEACKGSSSWMRVYATG